jgi:hypothetical protein
MFVCQKRIQEIFISSWHLMKINLDFYVSALSMISPTLTADSFGRLEITPPSHEKVQALQEEKRKKKFSCLYYIDTNSYIVYLQDLSNYINETLEDTDVNQLLKILIDNFPENKQPCYFVKYLGNGNTIRVVNLLEHFNHICPITVIENNRYYTEYKRSILSNISDDDSNIGCIFDIEDCSNNEIFCVYLKKYQQDYTPDLPNNVDCTDIDAPLGEQLFEYSGDEFISYINSNSNIEQKFKILNRHKFFYGKPETNEANSNTDIQFNHLEDVNLSQISDGHMSREEGRFGSFPKHDSYGEEATGEETDYEDYAEYMANYEE